MAVIRSIEARQGLNPGRAPNITVQNPIGDAVSTLGDTVSSVALADQRNAASENLADTKLDNDITQRIAQMKFKNEEFRATQEMYRVQESLGTVYDELLDKADPSGEGFAKSVSDAYDARTKDYLSTIPENLRPKFKELIDTGKSEWLANAAKTETDQRKNWFRQGINETSDKLLIQIDSNPEAADGLIQTGLAAIEASDLPEAEKEIHRKEWKSLAVETRELALVRDNPEYAARYVGGSSGLAFSMPAIFAAVEFTESGGNPNAVSPKGATGLMQVMPATGREIAVQLGDTNFPQGGTLAEQQEYLKLPKVSRRYGQFYLGQMLEMYDGDLVAALAAYNAGPGRVGTKEEWQASGRDLTQLPGETQDYVKKIMGRLGGGEKMVAQNGEIDVSRYPIQATPGRKINLKNMNPIVIDRFRQLQASMGRVITLNSAFRDQDHNHAAGGAKQSKHLDGEALDLNVSDLSKAERIDLIKKASALGFTGIGVYENTIHLDTGSKRYWGPSHKAESLPSWATAAIQGHMNGDYGAIDLASSDELGGGPVGYAPVSIPDGLTFAAYKKVRQQAVASLDALQQAQRDARKTIEAQQTAASNARNDQLGLAIEMREVNDAQTILADDLLDNSQKTTLLKALRSRQGEDGAAVQRFISGEFTANPFNPDNRKDANSIYVSLSPNMESDEQRQALAYNVTQATGSVPASVQAGIRNALNGASAEAAGSALIQAQGLLTANRNAFAGRDGGSEIETDVSIYEGALARGMSPEQAAQRVLNRKDPEWVNSRKTILGEKKTKAAIEKEATASSIAGFLDPGIFASEPQVGVDMESQAAIVGDYRQMLEDALLETSDIDDAKSVARERFQKVYGVSRYNPAGGSVVMRNPVENAYPALEDNHEYIGREVIKDLKDAGITVEKGEAYLKSDEITDAEINAGARPSYRVVFKEKGSEILEVYPQRFMLPDADIKKIDQSALKNRTDRARQVQEENRKRRIVSNSDDGGRAFSLDGFLDEPAAPPLPGDVEPITQNSLQPDPVQQTGEAIQKTGAALRRQNRQDRGR